MDNVATQPSVCKHFFPLINPISKCFRAHSMDFVPRRTFSIVRLISVCQTCNDGHWERSNIFHQQASLDESTNEIRATWIQLRNATLQRRLSCHSSPTGGGGGLAFIQPSNCSLKTNEIQEKKQVKIMKQTYLIGGNRNASRNRNTRTRKRTRHTVWPFQRQTARYVKTLASRNSNWRTSVFGPVKARGGACLPPPPPPLAKPNLRRRKSPDVSQCCDVTRWPLLP